MMERIFRLFSGFFIKKAKLRNYVKERGTWGFGSSVYDYYFMMGLDPKYYPKYLTKAFYIQMNKKLNLKNPKTLSEKVQWLKLYDNLPIKTDLTDKVLARNWVKKRIGAEYLKPVLQVCDSFEEINFEGLPNRFIVKCNHGCKWHFVVKDKEEYLSNKYIFSYTRRMLESWLSQSFFGWSDFETQYKNIVPKIIIEPMLCSENNRKPYEIEILCFNSIPKILKTYDDNTEMSCYYDEKYNGIDLKFSNNENDKCGICEPNEFLSTAVELSKKLAKDFKLLRVDWLLYNNKLYFNELTFTPYSGYFHFLEKYDYWDRKLGNMLNLKGS